MRAGAWWISVASVLASCGTVEPGPAKDLSIRAAELPAATVGFRYDDLKVVLQLERGTGPVSWSLPVLPPQLEGWLSINPDTGQLLGTPLDLVSPAARFAVQVTSGTASAQQQFSLSVGCREGVRSACGVPDPAEPRCIAGSRLCQSGTLGACVADVGTPPYEGDTTQCGAGCAETCSRTASNRCVGVCTCGSGPGPCSGPTPVCCPGSDGRPESYACVSLQTPEHCGACQTACPSRPFTTPGCTSSACTYACVANYLNCNGGPVTVGADADGCETRVVDNTEACGSCGHRCPDALAASKHAGSGRQCTDGRCRYTCDGAWRNCTGATAPACSTTTTDDDPDGCETNFADPGSCNGVLSCPGIANGYATCTPDRAPTDPAAVFSCGQACNPLFDPVPCDGVCRRLNDPQNCGSCGRSCPTIQQNDLSQECRSDGKCCVTICDSSRKPPCETVCY